MDRIQQMQASHPWLQEDQARLLLCRTYLELHDKYEPEQVPDLMSMQTLEYCLKTEEELKDTLACVNEWTSK